MSAPEGTSQRVGSLAGPLRRAAEKADPAGVASRATARGSAALGKFLREQRQFAQLSLREMAKLTQVSNAYLSQVERGLHEPSVRVLTALAEVLDVPLDELVSRIGSGGTPKGAPHAPPGVEAAIRADPHLSAAQKDALLSVYRSYRAAAGDPDDAEQMP